MTRRFLAMLLLGTGGLMLGGCLDFQAAGHIEITEDALGNFTQTVLVSGDGTSQYCSDIANTHFDCTYSAGEAIAADVQLYGLAGIILALIDPLVVQVPVGASNFSGTFDNGAGTSGNLRITGPLSSLPVDLSSNLVAEPGMQLIVIDFPASAPPLGRYHYTLEFNVPFPNPQVELKAMFTGRVDIGGTSYYPPLVPCVTDFANVPGTTLSAGAPTQSLLAPAYLSALLGTGCNGKTYLYGPTSPGGPPTVSADLPVPALDAAALLGLIVLVGILGAIAARNHIPE